MCLFYQKNDCYLTYLIRSGNLYKAIHRLEIYLWFIFHFMILCLLYFSAIFLATYIALACCPNVRRKYPGNFIALLIFVSISVNSCGWPLSYILFRGPFARPSAESIATIDVINACIMHSTTNGSWNMTLCVAPIWTQFICVIIWIIKFNGIDVNINYMR